MIYVLRIVVIRCVDIFLRLLTGINNYKHIHVIIQYLGMPLSEFYPVSENTLSMSLPTYFACGNKITNKITIFVFIQSLSCACGFSMSLHLRVRCHFPVFPGSGALHFCQTSFHLIAWMSLFIFMITHAVLNPMYVF